MLNQGRIPGVTAWSEDPWGPKKNGWCLSAGTGVWKLAENNESSTSFLHCVAIYCKLLHSHVITFLC